MKLKFSHTSPKTRVPLVPFVPYGEKPDRTRVLTGQVLLVFKNPNLSRLSHPLSHPLQRDKWDKHGTNPNQLLVPSLIAVKACVYKGLDATGQMGHVGQAKKDDLHFYLIRTELFSTALLVSQRYRRQRLYCNSFIPFHLTHRLRCVRLADRSSDTAEPHFFRRYAP
jgi:hypothetical protein